MTVPRKKGFSFAGKSAILMLRNSKKETVMKHLSVFKGWSDRVRRAKLPFAVIWLVVVFCLEMFLFNMPSFHLVGGDYEETALSLADATVTDGDLENGVLSPEEGAITVAWEEIGRPVGTVALKLTMDGAATAELKIDASDDTNQSYRNGIAKATLIAGNERSHITVLRMSGNVHDLRLHIEVDEEAEFSVSAVTLNSRVPFRFSILRFGLLFLAGLFFRLLFTARAFKEPCSEHPRIFSGVSIGVTLFCLLLAVGMLVISCTSLEDGILGEFKLESGNQITQEIVDAFEAGQAHLLEEPSEELLAMDNPYDWSARSAERVSYLWDHCLYNGHYYSYYGISLVLLLFLPYHLLTGYYFSSLLAIFLCGALGIVFLSLTYRTFVRKFFPNIPVRLATVGLLTLQLSSGVWFCFCADNFYEIAQASGFLFVTMGAYFLLSANVIGGGKLSPVRTALATASLSLAVLSRPTTAVYCIVALVFLFFGLKKAIAARRESGKTAPLVGFILCAVLPFAFFGGIQMIYNYLRFDSFLDFGIQYSLTINDFTRAQFHPRFVSIGVYNYLIAPPVLSPDFPYIRSSFQSLHPNGYYFIANYYTAGLLWRALPVLGLFLAPKAWKKLDKKQRPRALALLGALSLAAPAVILFSIWESGYGVRYVADFGWEMVIGALAILFFLYETCENDGVREIGEKALIFSLIPTAVINFALPYTFLQNELSSLDAARFFANLEALFNFWH